MEPKTEPSVVGVRFSKVGKIYHFLASNEMDIKVGDQVVVETSRGWQLGQVAQVLDHAEPPPEGWKPIDRRATPRDLLLRQMWQMKEAEVVSTCKAKAIELKLSGIKIVMAEYSFDGSRLTILFSTETEEKYDLKSLRQDMQKLYGPSQVEMRQIGPRDMAKVTCGMGACGLETRCCCLFLTEFSSISIRMAKEQGISLTPSEITGMCGRLRCCLIYEYDTYVDARAKLPKRNKRVVTPQGEGKVVDVIPLRGSVVVEIPEVGRREFSGDEVTIADDSAPQPGVSHKETGRASEIERPSVERAKPIEFEVSEILQDEIEIDTGIPDEETGAQPPQAKPGRPRGGGRGQKEGQVKRRPKDRGAPKQAPARSPSQTQPNLNPEQRAGGAPGTNISKKKKDRRPARPSGAAENRPADQTGAGEKIHHNRDSRKKRGRHRDQQNPES